jgi:hypothetical protein
MKTNVLLYFSNHHSDHRNQFTTRRELLFYQNSLSYIQHLYSSDKNIEYKTEVFKRFYFGQNQHQTANDRLKFIENDFR